MSRNNFMPPRPPSPTPGPPPPSYGYNRYDRPPLPQYPPPPGDGPSRRDDYHFRGPYSDLRRTHPDDHRRVDRDYSSRDRDRDRNGNNDNYRPPQGDFTFRVERPPGVESYDSYRPPERNQRGTRKYGPYNYAPWARGTTTYHHGNSYGDRRNGNGPPTGPRHDNSRRQQRSSRVYRTRGGPYDRKREKASDRLLLMKNHEEEQPELMLGDTTGRATYRDVDDLSDSDEAEMDISDNSDLETAEPATKRARIAAPTTTKPEQDAPKWSNPDPYTALPPPDESSRKKKDMVHLIRKARVESGAKKPAAQTEGLDFISCDFSDDLDQIGKDATGEQLPNDVDITSMGATLRGAASTLPPKPAVPQVTSIDTATLKPSTQGTKRNPIDLTPSTSFGNRKRTFDDTIKSSSRISLEPSTTNMGHPPPIASQWQPKDNPCPWAVNDHSATSNVGTRLHKELMDFYHWVRPRPFEERVRNEVIKNLREVIKKKWHDTDLYPFGSFKSGLYLPTGDMDIAICSTSFVNSGIPRYNRKANLFALKQHLINYGVPEDDEVEVISGAKVPILKYRDRETGLNIDISFEKLDGYNAIQTFLHWRTQYPAMPILVAIIKQFLLMRKANEPVDGGIGGFSVVCMVVNLFNMMPQVQSRSIDPLSHIGEMFMEFLAFYGRYFKYTEVAIRMNPPGLVPKNKVSTVVYRNMDRLSILDPNNPENDIAGGSRRTDLIFTYFMQAHGALRLRMGEAAKRDEPLDFGNTILGPILGGNYAIFQSQRDFLERLDAKGVKPYRYQPPRRPQW